MDTTTTDAHLFDAWTHDYCLLGLRLDRLAEGTVDAWLGPPVWRKQVLAEALPSPIQLRDAADDLLDRLPHMAYGFSRREYLSRQVKGLHTVARVLAGEEIPFAERVALCYDIRPESASDKTFEQAHRDLDRLLPGSGALRDRIEQWRRTLVVPPDDLPPLLERIAAETRSRTIPHLPLPHGESVEIKLVQNEPWSGYNWYLGGARSRVDVNTDLPVHAHTLVDLMAHEGYPGHHTEHALREVVQLRERELGEYAVQLIGTPESVISEGIATSARGVIFEGADDLRWLAGVLSHGIGPALDPERAHQIREAVGALRGVDGNAALMLHEDGRSEAEVTDYLANWSLRTPEGARKRMEFLTSPLWATYVFTYSCGRDLMRPLLEGADRFDVLKRIMTEPVYPSALEAWR